jgi:hypothetical protein
MLEPGHISHLKMREYLREAYSYGGESSPLGQLAHLLRDPAKPMDEKGHTRLHPVFIVLCLLGFAVVCVFLCFSFPEISR